MTLVTGRPWLVVVRRDQTALYAYLRRGFGGLAFVEVILDRRTGGLLADGRGGGDGASAERRRPATLKERTRWRSFGYSVVAPPDAARGDAPSTR